MNRCTSGIERDLVTNGFSLVLGKKATVGLRCAERTDLRYVNPFWSKNQPSPAKRPNK